MAAAIPPPGTKVLRVRLVKAVFPHAASYFVGLQLGSDATQKKKTERAPRSVAPSFERNTFVWTLPVGDAEVNALLQGNLHLGAYVALPAAEAGQGATTPPKRKSRQLGSATVALGSLSAGLRAGVAATTQCAFMRRSSRTDHHDAPVGLAMIEVQLFKADDTSIDTVVESPIDCLEVSVLGVRVSGAKAGVGATPTLRLQARALNAVAAKAVEEADRARALAAEGDGPPSDALAAIVKKAADACRATTIVAVTKAVQCDAAAGAEEEAEPGVWVCDWNSKLWVSIPTALGRTDPDAPSAALAPSAAIRIELAELIDASASTSASKPSRARFAPVAGFSVPVADVEAGRQYRVRVRVHASRSAAKLTKLFPDGVTELDVDIDVAFEIHRAAPSRARAIECYEAGVVASAAVVAAAAAGPAANEEEQATNAAAQRAKACAAMLKNSLAVLTLLSAQARAQLKPAAAVEKLPAPITQCASTAELHQLLRADSMDGQAAGMKPLPTLRSLDRATLRSAALLAATGAGRLAATDALPATSTRFCLNEGTSTSAAAAQVGFPLPDESAPAVLVRFFSRDARGFYATLAGYGVAPLPADHAKDGAPIVCALPLQFVASSGIENESGSVTADNSCTTVALRRFAGASAAERLAGESSTVGFDECAAGSLDGAQLIQLWCAGNKVRDTLRKKRGMVSALQGAAGALLAASKKPAEVVADADLEVSSDGEGASASSPASPVGAAAAEAEVNTDVAAMSPKSAPASPVAGDAPPATVEAKVEAKAEAKVDVEAAAVARAPSPTLSATAPSPAQIASPLPQPAAAAQPVAVLQKRSQPQRAANVPSTSFSAQDISSALTTPSRMQQQLINTQQQLVQAQQQLAAASAAQAESRVAVYETTSHSAHSVRDIAHTESAVRQRIADAVREMAEKLAVAENKVARAEAGAARAEEKASSVTNKLGEEREQRAAASAARDAAVDARTLIENQLASLNSDVAHKRALIDRLTTEVDDRAAAVRRCSVEVLHLQRANDKLAHEASELREKKLRDGKAQIRAGEDALVSANELDQVISLAAVGAASSDPATTDLVLHGGRDVGRLNKDVVHRLRVVTTEHRDAERRSKRAQGEMAQMKRQLVGSRLVVERLRKLEKAHMTQQRALQQLQVRRTLTPRYAKESFPIPRPSASHYGVFRGICAHLAPRPLTLPTPTHPPS